MLSFFSELSSGLYTVVLFVYLSDLKVTVTSPRVMLAQQLDLNVP